MNEMYNADYLINIAAMKAHARSGVTLTAKNHFGSSTHGGSYSAERLHVGSINTTAMSASNGGNDNLTNCRGSYHMYRVLTDILVHPKLGGNTVLAIVDGLWGGIESTDMPAKWKIFPFKNSWPNSLFVSQDELAVESVCLDFLRAEAQVNTLFNNRPFFPAVDDFLHQAADSTNWPSGIRYDPGLTGKEFVSMGIHEHWNNDSLKQYTRNLKTGTGIELYRIPEEKTTEPSAVNPFKIVNGFSITPNPARSASMVNYSLRFSSDVTIYLASMDGKIAKHIKQAQLSAGTYSDKINVQGLRPGLYLCVLKTSDGIKTAKLQVE
jgi:hypothetical protein